MTPASVQLRAPWRVVTVEKLTHEQFNNTLPSLATDCASCIGTNDPQVILCLTRQAEELESRGLYRRAATVWMEAFRESHSQPERNNFLARRERCLRKSSKRAASGEEWYLSGNYVGA